MSFKRVLNVVEIHDGEPMRVVTGGVPPIPGKTVYDKEEYLRLHNDSLRKFLLRDPADIPLCAATCWSLPRIPTRRLPDSYHGAD